MSLNEDVDLEEFVTTKDDLSGADIKAVCTEAGLLALRERRMRVTKADFTAAREKVRQHISGCLAHAYGNACRSCTGRTRVHQKDSTCDLYLSSLSCIFYRFPSSHHDGGAGPTSRPGRGRTR